MIGRSSLFSIRYLRFIILMLPLHGCLSTNKLVYLQNEQFNHDTPTTIANAPTPYTLKVSDIINIRIKTLDQESSAYFNLLSEQSIFNFNAPGFYLNSHSIDKEGYIELPGAGKIKVVDLTLKEAEEKVKTSLAEYLNNATVYVKLVSFKIAVLGEVRSPGYYFIYNEQANILEGLALAGDLGDFASRDNITLLRQTQDGSEAILIDLQKPDILKSPYYYLQPNDIIYVQPLKAKPRRNNLSAISALGLVFAALTATVLVLDYINPR